MAQKKTQKIFIPKGSINPNEDTIIEIPREMQEQPLVVAKGQVYRENNIRVQTTSRTVEYQNDPEISSNKSSQSESKLKKDSVQSNKPSDPACKTCFKTSQTSTTQNMTEDSEIFAPQFHSSEEHLPVANSSKKPSSASVRFSSTSTTETCPSRKNDTKKSILCLNESCTVPVDDSLQKPNQEQQTAEHLTKTGTYQDSSSNTDRNVDDLEKDRKNRLKKFYKMSSTDLDEIYIEQLKRQFEEAKRKLEEAVMLASMSLKRLTSNSRSYSAMCHPKCSGAEICAKAHSICDTVPERDLSFVPSISASSKPSDSNLSSKELKSADSNQLPASTPSISRMRTSVSLIRLKKDTDSQTPVKLSVKELILQSSSSSMDPEQNFFKVSSKCSASCAAKKSESLKFLKEPCCTNSSCESLAQKMSSIM